MWWSAAAAVWSVLGASLLIWRHTAGGSRAPWLGLLILGAGAGIIAAPGWLQVHVPLDPAGWPVLVVQTLAGNWSPPPGDAASAGLVWALGELAVLLNLGLVAYVVNVARRVGRVEQAVRLQDVYAVRDIAIRNSIISALADRGYNDIALLVDQAMQDGDRFWRERHLETLLGEHGRERLEAALAEVDRTMRQGTRV